MIKPTWIDNGPFAPMIKPTWIENSPFAPKVQIYDYVMIWDGKKRLSGFVEEIGLGWMRMYNGPTFPASHIEKFCQRSGKPFTRGTSALPVTHF